MYWHQHLFTLSDDHYGAVFVAGLSSFCCPALLQDCLDFFRRDGLPSSQPLAAETCVICLSVSVLQVPDDTIYVSHVSAILVLDRGGCP
jgi:hypothetical protein